MYIMDPYDDALRFILKHGIRKSNRTGVDTIGLNGLTNTYPLDAYQHFPFCSRRQLYPKSMFAELLWFLSGSTNNQDLINLGAKFWSKWCDINDPKYVEWKEKYHMFDDEFGPIYGFQLRHFGANYRAVQFARRNKLDVFSGGFGFDQLAWMMNELKTNPSSRRILFNLWNPNDVPMMRLPPCHYTYQVIVDGQNRLSGIMTQRSCDFPVGVPVNIAFYSALTLMLAQQAGLEPREFIHETHDSHIYVNQIEAVEQYLASPITDSPRLEIRKAPDIFSYQMSDFNLVGYEPGPKIDVPVAV